MPRASLVFALLLTLTCASTSALRLRSGQAVQGWSELWAFNTSEQELSEDDALDRFEIDEWFLPKLNLELPALFDWSAADSAYYAHARHEASEHRIGLC